MILITIFTLIFQSTRPVRGETRIPQARQAGLYISIHSPRAGRDLVRPITKKVGLVISIHSPRAGRDALELEKITGRILISIHSPRAGRDVRVKTHAIDRLRISIHSPRAGRDWRKSSLPCSLTDFNPLAPCGARRGAPLPAIKQYIISIHSPRAGRDALFEAMLSKSNVFQSTRPVRGETVPFIHDFNRWKRISIHSPRAGRDARYRYKSEFTSFISIHSPRAGRDGISSYF